MCIFIGLLKWIHGYLTYMHGLLNHFSTTRTTGDVTGEVARWGERSEWRWESRIGGVVDDLLMTWTW